MKVERCSAALATKPPVAVTRKIFPQPARCGHGSLSSINGSSLSDSLGSPSARLAKLRPRATRVLRSGRCRTRRRRAKPRSRAFRLLPWPRGSVARPDLADHLLRSHPPGAGRDRLSRVAAERARGARGVLPGAEVHRGAHADHPRPARRAAAGCSRSTSGSSRAATRVNVAQQTFSGAASNDQRVQLIVAGGSLGPARGRGHPRGAGARRLLAADPGGRPHHREPAGHPRLHAAHPRDPRLHALPLARRRRAGRAARQGRRARRGHGGRSVLPGLPGRRARLGPLRHALRAALEPAAQLADHRLRAGRGGQRGLARARGRHPPAQVPDGHHRDQRAVPREQDAGAPARARRRSRPTSSSPPSSPSTATSGRKPRR